LAASTLACTPALTLDLSCSRNEDCRLGFTCSQNLCVRRADGGAIPAEAFPCADRQIVSRYEMVMSPIPQLEPLVKNAKLFVCPKGFAISGIHTERHVPETDTILTLRCVRIVRDEDVSRLETELALSSDRQMLRVCPGDTVAVGAEFAGPALQCARLSGGGLPFTGDELKDWNRGTAEGTVCEGNMHCCPPGAFVTGWQPYEDDFFCRRLSSLAIDAPLCRDQ
jgi:hypothetical protein